VAGELLLGGDGLARGYHNRPELTAERFIPDTWGRGTRLYRTGDLVRRRADGLVEFLGRLDSQVKIRGFRIEPGEIEAVLATHPDVRACAVLARQDVPGETRLVAYAALGPQEIDPLGAIQSPALELRVFLQLRLPDFMVPAEWVLLDELPLTANGKVDRRALPAPQRAAAGRPPYAAPSGLLEEALAAVWAEVLRLDRVGAEDDFFALGGHSMMASQVVARVRARLGVELPLRRIFEAPNLRRLAESLSGPALTEATVETRDGLLHFADLRLPRPDPEDGGHRLAVRLSGPLSVETLERACAAWAEAAAELSVLDLSAAPEKAREEWALQLALEDSRALPAPSADPRLRLGLLRLGAQEHLLLVPHVSSSVRLDPEILRKISRLYVDMDRPRSFPYSLIEENERPWI
jgi:hypothetical protein